jgi:hypothetical protein
MLHSAHTEPMRYKKLKVHICVRVNFGGLLTNN